MRKLIALAALFLCLTSGAQIVNRLNVDKDTIEDEIRKSMVYHRYQEAVLARYESACRDLGLVDEQKDWLLDLLMAEKNRVDKELADQGGGHI